MTGSEKKSLPELRLAAAGCRACGLWERATQTVFGEGAAHARIMFVGEQPGNEEDLAGKPFVGPAGKIFDAALEAAEIDRAHTYITNAVKHFKWEPRGKRRIHAKPNAAEVQACLPWLHAELEMVKPKVLVLMGATAAQAVFGTAFRITQERGKLLPSNLAQSVVATVHPSSILRAPDSEARETAMQGLITDFRFIAGLPK